MLPVITNDRVNLDVRERWHEGVPSGERLTLEGALVPQAQELQRAGATVLLAEPAETSARRGPKRRAKTDRGDARHLRELLLERRLPLAWIPPAHILDLRARVRLRKTLVDTRTEWLQRIHAVLFHHGARLAVARLDGRDVRKRGSVESWCVKPGQGRPGFLQQRIQTQR